MPDNTKSKITRTSLVRMLSPEEWVEALQKKRVPGTKITQHNIKQVAKFKEAQSQTRKLLQKRSLQKGSKRKTRRTRR